jgi:hypothetical protein
MSPRDFEHMLPEDLPPFVDDDAAGDAYRDSLADLNPVPAYQVRPMTRAELVAMSMTPPDTIDCGQQLPKESK